MEDKRNINVVVKAKSVIGDVIGLTVLRPLSSTMPQITTNEIPILLNSIVNSGYLDAEKQFGFTYTFPFALAPGRGFPYTFNFHIEGIIRLS